MKYILGTAGVLAAIGTAAYFYIKHVDAETPGSNEESEDATPGDDV